MKVLVTAIGSFSADYVISSLKRAGHVVVGCDIYPSEWHAVSKDCLHVYQIPLASATEQYVEAILKICEEQQIDYIFPLTDVEVDVLSAQRERFAHSGAQLCIQSKDSLRIARNKYAICCLFRDDARVNVPTFSMSDSIMESFPLPAIAKPINGRSSEGLCEVDSVEELMRLKSRVGYVVQRKLTGAVITVDYVRDSLRGTDVAIAREELLRTKNGAGVTVRILSDPVLTETVSYIGNKLGVNGCINMEFIQHEGQYYLIDINPRFSAGVAFSGMVGYDMVAAHLACFRGDEVESLCSELPQVIITKRYIEEIL